MDKWFKRSNFLGATLWLFGICVSAPTAHSMPLGVNDPQRYDVNDDGFLSRLEADRAINALSKARGSDAGSDLLDKIEELSSEFDKQKFVSLARIRQKLGKHTVKCDRSQSFYLRKTLFDIPVLDCPEFRPKSLPASISYSGDFENGIDSLSLAGVFAVTLVSPGRFQSDRARINGSPFVEDIAVLAFAESNGEFSSTGVNKGYNRFGLNTELRIQDGWFDAQWIDLAAYWQSDFNFSNSVVGGLLAWSFQNTDLNIGGFVSAEKDPDRYYYWDANLEADYFYVVNAGTSDFGTGDNHAWIGGNLGLRGFVRNQTFENGINLHTTGRAFWDAFTDRSALSLTAGISFNLDKKQQTSIGIDYTIGESKESLQKQNVLSLKLKAKF